MSILLPVVNSLLPVVNSPVQVNEGNAAKTDYSINDLQQIRARVQSFVNERNWTPFHTPKNLLLALCGEGGELCEIFQWRPEESMESSQVTSASSASSASTIASASCSPPPPPPPPPPPSSSTTTSTTITIASTTVLPFVIPEKDLIHLGEEVSDVFIYSLRLAEICQIDLGLAINHILGTSASTCASTDTTTANS